MVPLETFHMQYDFFNGNCFLQTWIGYGCFQIFFGGHRLGISYTNTLVERWTGLQRVLPRHFWTNWLTWNPWAKNNRSNTVDNTLICPLWQLWVACNQFLILSLGHACKESIFNQLLKAILLWQLYKSLNLNWKTNWKNVIAANFKFWNRHFWGFVSVCSFLWPFWLFLRSFWYNFCAQFSEQMHIIQLTSMVLCRSLQVCLVGPFSSF